MPRVSSHWWFPPWRSAGSSLLVGEHFLLHDDNDSRVHSSPSPSALSSTEFYLVFGDLRMPNANWSDHLRCDYRLAICFAHLWSLTILTRREVCSKACAPQPPPAPFCRVSLKRWTCLSFPITRALLDHRGTATNSLQSLVSYWMVMWNKIYFSIFQLYLICFIQTKWY